MRYPRMDDFYTRVLAAEVGAAVVSVDYDVAPQRAYPVAQHQAHDVAAWFAAHGDELGLDGSRIALSGFSAGGNLAASAALQARDTGAPPRHTSSWGCRRSTSRSRRRRSGPRSSTR